MTFCASERQVERMIEGIRSDRYRKRIVATSQIEKKEKEGQKKTESNK